MKKMNQKKKNNEHCEESIKVGARRDRNNKDEEQYATDNEEAATGDKKNAYKSKSSDLVGDSRDVLDGSLMKVSECTSVKKVNNSRDNNRDDDKLDDAKNKETTPASEETKEYADKVAKHIVNEENEQKLSDDL